MSYFPEDELKSERLLFLTLERNNNSGYAHMVACVVRRAVCDSVNPDSGAMEYADGDFAEGYRHCKFSKSNKSGLYVEGMQLRGQITVREFNGTAPTEPHKIYGIEVRFVDTYHIDARKAAAMVDTFKKINKGMQKIASTSGPVYDDNFYGNAIRLASILGIKKIVTVSRNCSGSNLGRADQFMESSVVDIDTHVNKMLTSLFPSE